MPDEHAIVLSPALTPIVAAPAREVDRVVVADASSALGAAMRDASARMRAAGDVEDITGAVRTMYKRVGIDPTKTRPSSEALLRRVRRGDELPRINCLVDVINWGSLESRLPFGLYDLDRIDGEITLRLGTAGEEYAGIRKDAVHVAGRLTLADRQGPFGNPTSDSARTMVTAATTRALVVVFSPPAFLDAARRALVITAERIDRYCRGAARTPGYR